MKVNQLAFFLFPWFFCSCAVAAEREEKSQVEAAGKACVHAEEDDQLGRPRSPVSRSADGEDERPTAKSRSRLRLQTMALSEATTPLEVTRDGMTLKMTGVRAGDAALNFDEQLEDMVVLRMDKANPKDVVIPLTNAIQKATDLERIEVVNSHAGDSFLFFLGSALRTTSGVHTILLDGNHFGGIGLKSILLGLYEMKGLQHLSWRFMDLQGRGLPFDAGYVRKKKGYPSFTNDNIRVNVSGKEAVYKITFYEKPVMRWLAEDLAPAHPALQTLDLTGSFTVKNSEDRDHLFALLDAVEQMTYLQTLGLGHIPFDGFSIRKLARVLEELYQKQSVQGETVSGRGLKVVHLPNVLKAVEDLGDLRKVFNGLLTVEEVDLSENNMGRKGIQFFAHILQELRALRVLKAGGNKLFAGKDTPTRSFEELSAALTARKDTLEEVDLSNNGLDANALQHLKDALATCSKLVVLDLRENPLREGGLFYLAEIVKGKPDIRVLISEKYIPPHRYEALSARQKEKILLR